MKFTIGLCKPGEKIYDICMKSDQNLKNALTKVYQKKKHFKGVCFPTSISVNEVCGNFSPNAEDTTTLQEGDVAKIDLGVHINGFSAVIAHTVVCSSTNAPVTGKKADVILAAYNAVQNAVRSMHIKPENTNNSVTSNTRTICESYKVSPVEGVLSHRMRRDIIDGPEVVINCTTFDQKVEERKFAHGDVFGLDVMVSTGEGKPREAELKCNVYKRAIENTYKLKTESGRKLLAVVEQNFHTFPFSLNSFDNESELQMKTKIDNFKTAAKMGLVECLKNELLHPYPIMTEKKGEIVAQFKYTIAVRNEGPLIISGVPLDLDQFQSDLKIEDAAIIERLKLSNDEFLPSSKKSVKVAKKKDNKAKKQKKKENKEKRKEELKKKMEAEQK
jgi:curved DNA binding protein